MKKIKEEIKYEPVSVITAMRNASTTVMETLKSVSKQKYPVTEMIVVDNVSKDNSREIVREYSRESKFPIKLLVQKKDKGVSSSYNWGVKEAKSKLVIFLSSDSSLPSVDEFKRLTLPFRQDPHVIASYATSVLPGFVWNTYNFWEKYHAARMVDNTSSPMVTKCDCLKKDVFLKVGGFDEINFGGDGDMGGEDADLNMRLREAGTIVRSKADSLHLHYMANDYTLSSMARSRKMYARSYGMFLRKSPLKSPQASIIFLIRPTLCILPFIPALTGVGIALLIIYSFLYSKKMFITKSTIFDPRIILIPFLNIFFLYYELFWLVKAYFSYKK